MGIKKFHRNTKTKQLYHARLLFSIPVQATCADQCFAFYIYLFGSLNNQSVISSYTQTQITIVTMPNTHAQHTAPERTHAC